LVHENNMSDKIAFIGAGNMARSLVGGLLKHGVPSGSIVTADPDAAQRTTMAALGVATTASNTEAVRGATTVVLAVKPQAMRDVVRGLRDQLGAHHLLISIAAGVPIDAMQRWCAQPLGIVRCMPNTPALYGAGVTALFANEYVTPQQRATAESTLSAVGHAIWVNRESALDAVTAVSGSGPAYFFYLMEAMIAAGVELGLDENTARTLTLRTASGAALMAIESGLAPAQLRRNVTSPGGTTEAAIAVLDANRCNTALIDALRQAANRSVELAVEFGAD
jgi:pyrroline-5-carboxylate reductase